MNHKFLAKAKKAVVLKRLLFAIPLFFSILYSLFSIFSSPLFAQQGFRGGELGSIPGSSDVATVKGFERVLSNLVAVALELAGVILFIMLLTSGFKYLTSQGDPKAVEGAKGTLTHAIIGLIVLILATVILSIIGTITGLNILEFKITQP